MEELKILGENLYRFRKKHNLSYQAIADSLGLSAAHVCRIENGTAKPSFDVLIQISQLMCVPLHYLFLAQDDTADTQEFVAKVQNCLVELCWSPNELAQASGVNFFKLLDFLQGKIQLGQSELSAIAHSLRLPEPSAHFSRRFLLLERLLSDFGLDEKQVQNILEYVQSVRTI